MPITSDSFPILDNRTVYVLYYTRAKEISLLIYCSPDGVDDLRTFTTCRGQTILSVVAHHFPLVKSPLVCYNNSQKTE